MDYINYVKQSPMMGQIGLGGGAASLGRYASNQAEWYGDRGVFAGGFTPNTNVIEYITITSTGNAIDFGDLPQSSRGIAPASNGTRGLFMGGRSTSPGPDTQVNYITIGTTGNASDFGDSTTNAGKGYAAGAAGSTGRALLAGGNGASGTVDIEYFTIATTGNGTDLADLALSRYGLAGCSNGTRAVFGGQRTGDYIDYKAIDTTANCTNFGYLEYDKGYIGGGQNDPGGRGFFSGSNVNAGISYITIASTGNAADFGDAAGNTEATSATSNATRGIIGGSYESASTNVINYITISSVGNATDFGDLSSNRGLIGATSGN